MYNGSTQNFAQHTPKSRAADNMTTINQLLDPRQTKNDSLVVLSVAHIKRSCLAEQATTSACAVAAGSSFDPKALTGSCVADLCSTVHANLASCKAQMAFLGLFNTKNRRQPDTFLIFCCLLEKNCIKSEQRKQTPTKPCPKAKSHWPPLWRSCLASSALPPQLGRAASHSAAEGAAGLGALPPPKRRWPLAGRARRAWAQGMGWLRLPCCPFQQYGAGGNSL